MAFKLYFSVIAFALMLAAAADAAPKGKQPAGLEKIGHIVVIYLENHSFDNLYGLFPGADGISQAKPKNTLQVDQNGQA